VASDPVYLQAFKAIADLIAVDFSSGYSGLDLSGSGQVVRGIMPQAPMIPSACVFMFDIKEDFGQSLDRYQAEIVFEIYGFCGGTSLVDRMDNACRLGGDLINALTTDRTLGLNGLTDDVICNFAALEGDRYQVEGVAIAYIEVKVKYQSSSGV
tara:strand:- start:506 stop:967 length:462 start_codon:yes stop_codon:yes gene_type:complete